MNHTESYQTAGTPPNDADLIAEHERAELVITETLEEIEFWIGEPWLVEAINAEGNVSTDAIEVRECLPEALRRLAAKLEG